DRFFGSRRKPTLLVVGFLAVLMTLWTSLFSPETPHGLVWLVVALLGLTLLGWNGLYLAFVSELAGSRIAGLAIGLSNTGAFLGIVVLPPIFGFVVDETGSYRLAWMSLAAVVLAAVAVLPWVKEERG
ncbi:MAG: MFS transporter, partial [Deltaproteobacteria bacterium]|nr:MFS transporter [Deltaproteobacteria bacterium]